MNKKTSPKSTKPAVTRNGKQIPLPETLPAEVAQAVLEDAVLAAAADIAALAATLGTDAALVELTPQTPEEEQILSEIRIPYLGATRTQALAEAGITTLADLRAATPEQIGGVKNVGMVNATRVKQWLETLPVASDALAPEAGTMENLSPVNAVNVTAVSNQSVQDALTQIADAAERIKNALPKKSRDKTLLRQLAKLDSVSSELPESFDTLRAKPLQRATASVEALAKLLDAAAEQGKFSEKRQASLSEKLRESRKSLEKALDS